MAMAMARSGSALTRQVVGVVFFLDGVHELGAVHEASRRLVDEESSGLVGGRPFTEVGSLIERGQLVNEDGQRIDEYYQQSLTSNAEISRS